MFHLTSALRWASIAAMGEILSLAELERRRLAKRPPSAPARAPWDKIVYELVWLTVNPLPRDHWLTADQEHKGDVIVTVEPGAQAWTTFARLRGFPERYLTELRELGNPSEWFVSTEPIPASRWLRVQEGRAGHMLWERGAAPADALLLCVDCKRSLARDETLDDASGGPLCVDCLERRAPELEAEPEPTVRRTASRRRAG